MISELTITSRGIFNEDYYETDTIISLIEFAAAKSPYKFILDAINQNERELKEIAKAGGPGRG